LTNRGEQMNIIQRLWWSLGRGNPVVPSRWQATVLMSVRNDEAPRMGPCSRTACPAYIHVCRI
jgi:hypothetical protein